MYVSITDVLLWILLPFLLPLTVLFLLFLNSFIVLMFKMCWKCRHSSDEWRWAAAAVNSIIWLVHGKIWHGYEVRGLENVPDSGPAMIIIYHGALPIDFYYFYSTFVIYKRRMINQVADHFFFRVPGLQSLIECAKILVGTRENCLRSLKEGNIVMIAPGGVYEAQFSHEYNLMWQNRTGFAKVAIDAQVPIIPMFTENIQESFRTVNIVRKWYLKLYAMTKLPLVPIYGQFPVKLITHIGKPIPYDPSVTPEQLKSKVAEELNKLIRINQRIPRSIIHAMIDRVPTLKERHKKNMFKHE